MTSPLSDNVSLTYLNNNYLIRFDVKLTHLCDNVQITLLGNWEGRGAQRKNMVSPF